MTNVGTGNVVVQEDDMSVPHKGIAMAFRRTYNSQSRHDVSASDAGEFVYKPSGLYGNGWTNTFDAHMARNAAMTVYTVFDIDGARYDYDATWDTYNTGTFTPRAGNHATLAFDGVCGWAWTKKNGTTYYFYAPGAGAPCPQLGGVTGGFAGRLYQIVGRNRNTSLTLSYYWDGGNASTSGKISQINVQSESGMTAQLIFADFNGHRLLRQLTFPDYSTAAFYAYDAQGNLTSTGLPPNNASGTLRGKWYGYGAIGTDTILQSVAAPRWVQGCNGGCGSDGEWIGLNYAGTSRQTAALSSIQHIGVINPIISDASGTGPLQSGQSTGASQYLTEYYTTGVGTPTFRDTNGHMTNWVVDGTGRPMQTQRCTTSANQGQQCTGIWLVFNETWDAANNATSVVDQRGYETDYAYDSSGNAIAVAQPATATNQGRLRATTLVSYDSFNNVTAVCDPNATHSLGMDWSTAPPGSGDLLCPQISASTRAVYTYPSWQPYGELSTVTGPAVPGAPGGYTRTYAYIANTSTTPDYGLPISITGSTVTQPGSSVQSTDSFQPLETFAYDGNGNVSCYGNGVGTWLIQYDQLGRRAAVGDPDDGSLPGCGKPSSSKSTARYFTYYGSGDLRYEESPIQRAADVASGGLSAAHAFTYDMDGNIASETHHYGCMTIAGCNAGVTQKWYDGADRLVEVAQPQDPKYDLHPYRWMVRYLFDLGGAGGLHLSRPLGGPTTPTFGAYGNLYDTQTWVDLGWSTDDSAPHWVDHLGSSYDALDRETQTFDVAIGGAPITQTTYDASPSTYGEVSTLTRASGESYTDAYTEDGKLASVTFSGDGGVTPSRTYSYTPSGLVASVGSTLGTESFSYDAVGRELTHTEPAAQGGNLLSYSWTPNGLKTSLTISGAMNEQLFQYAYRHDGQLSGQYINTASGWQSVLWTRTPAGLVLQRTDPTTGLTVTNPNGANMSGLAAQFVALAYTLDTHDALTTVRYSNGYTVQNIATDLEGARSTEWDSVTSSVPRRGTHNSVPVQYTTRNEVSAVGPLAVNSGLDAANTVGFIQANGIKTRVNLNSDGTPAKSYPLSQRGDNYNIPLDMLDGQLQSSSANVIGTNGSYSAGYYTDSQQYDAAGRARSTDEQLCRLDQSATESSTEQYVVNGYDAENHTISSTTYQGSSGTTGACRSGSPWDTQWTWTYSWGTNDHPYKIYYNNPTYNSTAYRYLHWDGDQLLFTSITPNGPPDDIKIGSLGDLVPASGDIAIYDRDSAGASVDSHTTQSKVFNGLITSTPYNDVFGGPGVNAAGSEDSVLIFPTCTVPGDCTFVTEPTPDRLSGLFGFSIQGARVADTGGSGQWTTPDESPGVAGDPSSRLPYAYNRNNAFAYSDPSGFSPEEANCDEWCAASKGSWGKASELPEIGSTRRLGPPAREAAADLRQFNLTNAGDAIGTWTAAWSLLGWIAPETKGATVAADIFEKAGTLTPWALRTAKLIIPATDIKNVAIPGGFAKYTTKSFSAGGHSYQVHFYMDPESGEVFYGRDYKTLPVGKKAARPW
ncbi:MAG TPA: DUF6531 domain-containing protein [Candidatus Elarobacter sp.]|jgi:YD repeat-containing protein